MKNFKHIVSYRLFNEALLPSQFRKYVKEFNRDRYEEKFQEFKKKYDGDRNAYRLYLPYESDIQKSEIESEIENLLSENGYEIIDYVAGVAKFKDAKNPSKIGKVLNSILNKTEDKERVSSLIKKFIEDPIRKSGKEEMLVCISRHPYDIAGADTDRKWTNCMTIGTKSSKRIEELKDQLSKLNSETDKEKIKEIKNKLSDIKEDGMNVRYLLHDVKEGSLIAYLIKSTDKNINNPIANLNIKPYINVNDENDFILLADNRMYGNGNKIFKKTVDDFLEEFNGPKKGTFARNNKIYNDSDVQDVFYGISDQEVSNVMRECQKLLKNIDCQMTFFIAKGISEGKAWDTEFSDINKMIDKTIKKMEYGHDCVRNLIVKIKSNGGINESWLNLFRSKKPCSVKDILSCIKIITENNKLKTDLNGDILNGIFTSIERVTNGKDYDIHETENGKYYFNKDILFFHMQYSTKTVGAIEIG